MRVYAIGDIHGQLDMLRAAHARITADREICGDAFAPVVHLGDFCDRGPDTAGVIAFLIDGRNAGHPWQTVLGNHDRLFRNFLRDPHTKDMRLRSDYTWLTPNMGGRETLRSYGVGDSVAPAADDLHRDALARVPADHIGFLDGLETYIHLGELVFVHAGIRPGIPIRAQTEDDLIWIRSEFLYEDSDHGMLIVHGHTPVDAPMHCGNRVNLDTGAGYFRPLTAAVFEGRDCWILSNQGREPLTPQPWPIP